MADRPPPPWATWSAEQWTAYRQAVLDGRARCGEPWWELTGSKLVRMADAHLARLAAQCPA